MDRFSRKNRTDVKYQLTGPITDLIDNAFKSLWRINDEELDYICNNATDDELSDITLSENATISDIKKGIETVNRLLVNKNNLVV